MATLQPFPSFNPSTPRIVSNKENSDLTTSSAAKNRSYGGLRPTARPTGKPRMGGIGRPKHALFKSRHPSASHRPKQDRLASIHRAQLKSKKTKLVKGKQAKESKGSVKPVKGDKENGGGKTGKGTSLSVVVEKPSTGISSLPYHLSSTSTASDSKPIPRINIQPSAQPTSSSDVAQLFFQARTDLQHHKPGEPYGYVHVYNAGSTQCFPFGFPADRFPVGPIVPQSGNQPVFFSPTGQLVVPAGTQAPGPELRARQAQIHRERTIDYARKRQERAQQGGSPPYSRQSPVPPAHTPFDHSPALVSTSAQQSHRYFPQTSQNVAAQAYSSRSSASQPNRPLIYTPPNFLSNLHVQPPQSRGPIAHPIYTNVLNGSRHTIPVQHAFQHQLQESQRRFPPLTMSQPGPNILPETAYPDHPFTPFRSRSNVHGSSGSGSTSHLRGARPYTTLFPKMPTRILMQAGDKPVWPFHVVPLMVETPKIPAIVHTSEDGVRVPGEYALARMADHLPKVYDMCTKFAPLPHRPNPHRINTPQYSFGPRLDDQYVTLPFWNEEAVYHAGLTEEGRRATVNRGPDICLVVRDRDKPDSEGVFVPVNHAVMKLTCAHFDRMVRHGRSLTGRGDQNPFYHLSREERDAAFPSDVMGHRPTPAVPGPVRKAPILSIPIPAPRRNPMDITTLLTPSASRNVFLAQSRSAAPAAAAPVAARTRSQNSLFIIPTPPIGIRHGGQVSPNRSMRHMLPADQRPRPGHGDTSDSESDARTDTTGTISHHVTSDMGLDSCIETETTSDSDDNTESDASESSSTAGPSDRGTIMGSPPVQQSIPMVRDAPKADDPSEEADDESEDGQPSERYYNSSKPFPIDLSGMNFHRSTTQHGLKMLPLRPIYVSDVSTFLKALHIIHHPRQTIVGYLLGFDVAQWFNFTAQIEWALLALSPVECLRRAHQFHLLVQNLTLLGVAHKAIWEQVIVANKLLGNVLYLRSGIPNDVENKFVVAYMDGEGLPPVVFTPFSESMVKLHLKFTSDFEARAEMGGVILPDPMETSEEAMKGIAKATGVRLA